jgi:hypothetical protein
MNYGNLVLKFPGLTDRSLELRSPENRSHKCDLCWATLKRTWHRVSLKLTVLTLWSARRWWSTYINRVGLVQIAFRLLRPSGYFIVDTPYHGYVKNLALALSGELDSHFTALWDGGHIKFWSRETLSAMLIEEGFTEDDAQVQGAYRIFGRA